MEQAQQEARQSLSQVDARLHAAFSRYFPGETYRDGFTQALLGARQEYLALLAQAQRMKEEREKIANHIGEIQKTLREFLRPYYPEALPEDLRAGAIEGALRMEDAPKKKGAAGRAERRKPGAFAGADGKHPGGSFALSGAR